MTRCETKASKLIGMGPIKMNVVTDIMKDGTNYEQAKIKALHDFLRENLGYIDDKLENLAVAETKFSKDNVLYVAITKN